MLHNLRDVTASFPIGLISAVTGVSGSGKSTLVHDVLYQRLMEARGQRPSAELGPAEVLGDCFEEIILVDQSSIPRTVRSNALTFSGAFSPIRDLFARTEAAGTRGFRAGDFSFNTAGGRCENCQGVGTVTVEMHFIADIRIPCDVCNGRRYRAEVLDVRYRGRSIADVFEMTAEQAVEFFGDVKSVVRRLRPLVDVGLGYLKLGQSTAELSGGEAQRLKLASYVGRSRAGQGALFLFDEPTVGLHMSDVEVLLDALRSLRSAGHTVIVVEHNLDLVAGCDWVVDLGPGGGPEGGAVLFEGPVVELLGAAGSRTGIHLAGALEAG